MNNLAIGIVTGCAILLGGLLAVNYKNNTVASRSTPHYSDLFDVNKKHYTKYKQDMHEKRTREFEKNLFKSFRTQRKTESSNKLGGTRRKFK